MKELLQPIIDLIKALVTPQQGTKFLVTAIGIVAIVYLSMKQLASIEVCVSIVLLAFGYHLSNFLLTKHFNGNGKKPSKTIEEETP